MYFFYRVFVGLLALCILPPFSTVARAGGESDWGPFYYRGTNVYGQAVERALGPFWEYKEDDKARTLNAVRPLYSKSVDPEAHPERWLKEYVWPLGSMRGHGNTRSGWFLTAIYMRDDVTQPDSRWRLWVLPFYFVGKARDGENYQAFFPFGGTIREFLVQDKIQFAFFPLWSRTRINDVHSVSILWPIYNHTESSKIYSRRVFPFWGVSKRANQYAKRFILWPFWTEAEYFFKGAEGKAWILFPIYGQARMNDQKTDWYIPPFFKISEGNGNRRMTGPWPFFQKSEGDVEKFYLFPLYGHKTMEDVETGRTVHRSFYLWPIGWKIGATSPRSTQWSRQILPFYYKFDHTYSDPAEQSKEEHHLSIWPLFSSEQKGESQRLRIPDLWPGRNPGGIERNWAPLWTLFHREVNGDAVQTELLWGMYRNVDDGKGYHHWGVFPLVESTGDAQKEEQEWQVLKGLFGWSRKEGNKSLKLLYFFKIPMGSNPP